MVLGCMFDFDIGEDITADINITLLIIKTAFYISIIAGCLCIVLF